MGERRRYPGCRPRVGLRSPAAVLLFLLASLAPAAGGAAAERRPVLAVEPFPGVAVLEYRTAALARWIDRGYSKAALVLVDAGPGLRPLGAAQAEWLARSGPARAAESYGSGRGLLPFELAYARTAVALGIVGEVYWISPFDHFRTKDTADVVKGLLRDAGVGADDLRTFALKDGCLRGSVGGTPYAACGIDGLPRIARPVLLSVDAEFILAAVISYATNPVAEIQRLFAALAARRYDLADAVVTASVENGFVPPDMRWVGETVAQAIEDPALFSRPEAPKRWKRMQEVALLLGKHSYSEMHHVLLPMLTIYEDDPALQLFVAEALAGLGKKEEALEHAEQACRLSPEYCSGLPWIGLHLLGDGDVDGGERFFAAGAGLQPTMAYGQLQRGLLLLRAGRPEQALQAFRSLSEGGRVLPAAFLAGALALDAGDRQQALKQFDRAIEALPLYPEAGVDDPEIARAVRMAARAYREEGAAGKAKVLEAIPGLAHFEEESPIAPP